MSGSENSAVFEIAKKIKYINYFYYLVHNLKEIELRINNFLNC